MLNLLLFVCTYGDRYTSYFVSHHSLYLALCVCLLRLGGWCYRIATGKNYLSARTCDGADVVAGDCPAAVFGVGRPGEAHQYVHQQVGATAVSTPPTVIVFVHNGITAFPSLLHVGGRGQMDGISCVVLQCQAFCSG